MSGMGKLEQVARARRRQTEIKEGILLAVATAGVISLALVAPKLLDHLNYFPRNRYDFNYRVKNAAERLVKKGYLMWTERKGKKYLRLTPLGERKMEFEKEKAALSTRKKKPWDERWRMLVFDIPERRHQVRAKLRMVMREVGFVRMQDSVWVYPYDCEDFIALLKADLKIGKDVLYAIAETIEHDGPLRKHFSLNPI